MSEPNIVKRAPTVILEEPGLKFWCACGKSSKEPYCDGSHKGTDFAPVKVNIEEEKKVAWCSCKHSKKGAICDGAHSSLPE